MAFAYTQQQQRVIDARGCNLLVSAAAGSGKTAVLVERILRIISDAGQPVDIDRLLIVTFTNAAAAEMRERIREAIGKKLEEEPENGHLQRQAALLHNAQITTIDSFCLFVIRNNFNDIGLDPGFRVADEGELKLLRREVLEELFEEWFAEGAPSFIRCLESFGGRDEQALAERILSLYDFSRSYPFPEEWLERAADAYAPENERELNEADWIEFAKTDIRSTLAGCRENLERALSLCGEADGPYMYAALLESEREMLAAETEALSFSELGDLIRGIAFGRLPSKKDESVSGEKRELAKALRNAVKEEIGRIRSRYFFFSLPVMLEDMKKSGETVRTLTGLTEAFGKRFLEKKREKNVIDFSDMEHYALQILLRKTEDGWKPSKAARDYRQFFYEILIDEYQDSNLVQEYLLQSISGEEEGRYNRFMVGDVKQSIYKFRLARPEIFMEKMERYRETGRERKIGLFQNFRSRREVTDRVNSVFARIMGKRLGGVEYDADAALYPKAAYPENGQAECELLLLEKDGENGLSKMQQEGALIASRIGRLMGEHQVTDKESGALRPVRYGDIAILLRSTAGWAEPLQNLLKEYGIPAHVTASSGYFSSEEIRTAMNFLRIVDNPLQDIPLFGVLISPIGGFTEKEIALLRTRRPQGRLYEAVLLEAEDSESGLGQRLGAFQETLQRYREKSPYTPVKQILSEMLKESGYLRYAAAFPGGEGRYANLEMLLLKAADFEKNESHGLFAFIRYMEQLEKYEVDYGTASAADEHADVVRIMSIHKSKGLEFPVCIVSGLARRFPLLDETKPFLMDVDLGMGCEYVEPEKRLRKNTLRRSVLSRKIRLDNLGEELRVLYVAMTRAKEKLILTACLDCPEKKLPAVSGGGQADGKLSYLTLSSAGSMLDLLLPAWPEPTLVSWEELTAQTLREHVSAAQRRARLERSIAGSGESELESLLEQRFQFRYAWENMTGLYTKTTVSELKLERMADVSEGILELFDTEVKEAYVPGFAREKQELSGSSRGSAYHKVMELLDFAEVWRVLEETERGAESADGGEDGNGRNKMTVWVKNSLAELQESGRLSEEERDCIQPSKIGRFLTSEPGRRMARAAAAGRLSREQPFVLGLSADRVDPAFPKDEAVLIQGIIDAYWEEEGRLYVLDYKTDRVRSGQELVGRYQTQLDYYAEALEKILGKPVGGKLLYSFSLNETVRCDA